MNRFESFCSEFPFSETTKEAQAVAFAWFHVRQSEADEFTLSTVSELFRLASLPKPNLTRLKRAFAQSKEVHKGRQANSFKLSRHTLEGLDSQYGHIFHELGRKISEQADVSRTPFLSDDDITDAARMAELYVVLHCYENSVRRFIEQSLSRHLGPTWWDHAANTTMINKYQSRKSSEEKYRWLSPRGNSSPLYYLEWGDLVSLMRKFENVFGPHIHDLKFVELRLEELERVRNIVAHHGVLPSEEDFQRVVLSFNDWRRQLS